MTEDQPYLQLPIPGNNVPLAPDHPAPEDEGEEEEEQERVVVIQL